MPPSTFALLSRPCTPLLCPLGQPYGSPEVFADTSLKVQAALEVGSASETVDVPADQVPLLKTDRADVSTTFSSQEIVDLPIPDRNFTNLQLLLPGA